MPLRLQALIRAEMRMYRNCIKFLPLGEQLRSRLAVFALSPSFVCCFLHFLAFSGCCFCIFLCPSFSARHHLSISFSVAFSILTLLSRCALMWLGVCHDCIMQRCLYLSALLHFSSSSLVTPPHPTDEGDYLGTNGA